VVAAVLAGDIEVGPGVVIMAAKQELGIGNADVFGMRRIEMDDGRTTLVTARTTPVVALGGGPISHSTLPATPRAERERLAHPLTACAPHLVFCGVPDVGARRRTMRYLGRARKIIVNKG